MRERARGLAREFMAAAGYTGGGVTGAAGADKDFSDLSTLNYVPRLARLFDPAQMSELMRELRRSLPDLNRNLFGETNPARLGAIAKELGVTFELQRLPALALRGFYVGDSTLSARPLIVVNAAYPKVGVAAAFWHEIGHHLTHDIFGKRRDHLQLSVASSHRDHLEQPEELAADLVTTLGAYPAATAKRLFSHLKGINNSHGSIQLVSKANGHLRLASGLEVSQTDSLKKKLHIVAGMIHIAKLRIALLEGYGI